jgi:hypothetical protein
MGATIARALEAKAVRVAVSKADQADLAQAESLVKAVALHFERLDVSSTASILQRRRRSRPAV